MREPALSYLKASLIYLLLSALCGLIAAIAHFSPPFDPWPLAIHVRILLAPLTLFALPASGMLLFATAYHLAPKLTSKPLHSPFLACLHFWLTHLAVALLFLSFLLLPKEIYAVAPQRIPAYVLLMNAGAAVLTLSLLPFAYNIWRTIR